MDINKQPDQKIGFSLYFKKLLFPVCAELLFILSYILWPEKVLYFNTVFSIIIVIYFRKLFSFRKWAGFFRLRQFWIAVGITAVLTYLLHKLTELVSFRELIGIPEDLPVLWKRAVCRKVVPFQPFPDPYSRVQGFGLVPVTDKR